MAAKEPQLDNSQALALHLRAGLSDNYLTEAQYILDDKNVDEQGNPQSIQDTINKIMQSQQNQEWATKQDVTGLFIECDEENKDEEYNK